MYAALPVLAGIASTVIFASSTLPMLNKALRTRELGSYSLGNLAMANVGNAVYSVYVFSLAPGPLWALHAFHLGSTAFMLVWFLRFEFLPRRRRRSGPSTFRWNLRDREVSEMVRVARKHPFRVRSGARKMWLYLRTQSHNVARSVWDG